MADTLGVQAWPCFPEVLASRRECCEYLVAVLLSNWPS
jgi:hypothetical protein